MKVKYILIIGLAAAFFLLLKVLTLNLYPDFAAYYVGAKQIVNGVDPYAANVNYFTHQVYPPFSMIFFIPFTIFSIELASILWIGLSIVILFCTIFLIIKTCKEKFSSNLTLVLIILTLVAFPVKFTLGMGQINIIILFLITCVFYFLNKKKETIAGALLSLPIMLKFFPILLLPYLVWIKKWKTVIICCIGIMVFMACTLLFVPITTVTNYFFVMLPELLSSWKGDYYNQSLAGFLIRLFPSESTSNILRIIISSTLLIATFIPIFLKKKKTTQRLQVEFVSILVLTLLINNFSWQHHFVLLTLPFFVIAYTIHRIKNNLKLFLVLSLSYILIAANLKTPDAGPLLIQSHVFYGGVLLWILSIYLLMKSKL